MITQHPDALEQGTISSFAGANEKHEIEDLLEFQHLVKGKDPKKLSLKGWVFQEVDFSEEEDLINKYNVQGAYFFGCTFPKGITVAEMRNRGASIFENATDLPFKPFRAFMYTVQELQQQDANIYDFYLKKSDVISTIHQSTHDYSIRDALYDYLEGKSVVSIMGGHQMTRGSDHYRQVVILARTLAREGFLVTTGGGPGAMEAANLGAYLSNKDDGILDDVIKMLQEGSDKFKSDEEYKNTAPADAVVAKYGLPKELPSLGIPTWKYGHEPSNRFATWYIFTPGSAGTRQEIFQNACLNHYANENECSPMIFMGEDFWKADGVFQLVAKTAGHAPYSKWLKISNNNDEVVEFIKQFRSVRRYPVMTLEMFKGRFWEKGEELGQEEKEGEQNEENNEKDA